MNKLHQAAIAGDLAGVQGCVSAGAPIDSIEPQHGNTALMLAAYNNHASVLAWLIDAGATLDARCHERNTALMKAAWSGATECVERLVRAGAAVNACEREGMTALMVAAFYGHLDVVRVLLKAGADVNRTDSDGYTALKNAQARGHAVVAALLKETMSPSLGREHRRGKDLHITVLTRMPLNEPAVALPLLRAIADSHQDLRPIRYGPFEPLRGRLAVDADVAEVMAEWREPTMFFSNGRRSNMSVFFGSDTVHARIHINCLSSRVSSTIVADLTRQLAVASEADLAVAYIWRGDGTEWRSRYEAVEPMCLGPTTHDIKRSLPDLAWHTVWGPPYVALFGPDRLISCPSFRSRPVSEAHWEVQLTEKARARDLALARDLAKVHLGSEHFLDLAAPERQQRAPALEWALPPRGGLEQYLGERGLLSD